MQMHKPISLSSDYGKQNRNPDHFVDELDAEISREFNRRLQVDDNDGSNLQKPVPDSAVLADDEEEFVDCEDEEENDGDGDFTFMYIGQNNSPISADKMFENSQIRPVFPLFDRNLLSGGGANLLQDQPRVDKVFVELPRRAPSSTSGYDEIEDIAAGPYCTWSKQPATNKPDLGKKSNSTGFSKLRKLRDKVGRSYSDGRDAFVFLNGSGRSTNSSKSVVKPAAVAGSTSKDNAAGGKSKLVKKGTKSKKTNLSAHEVYLRKREQTEEERRRSYLPYRPELTGFFTNVNGGLSKNIHPY